MGWGSAKGAIGGESLERKWNSSRDFIFFNEVLDSLCCRYHVKQVVIYDNLVCIGRVKRKKKRDSSLWPHPLLVIDFLGALSIPPLPPRPTRFYDDLFQQKQQNTASPSANFFLPQNFPNFRKGCVLILNWFSQTVLDTSENCSDIAPETLKLTFSHEF